MVCHVPLMFKVTLEDCDGVGARGWSFSSPCFNCKTLHPNLSPGNELPEIPVG